jgi:hypothetical protein
MGQNNSPSISAAPAASLGGSLRAGNTQLHIFYVHGIGAGGPDDYDSQLLRRSICKHLKDCIKDGGELDGTEYADQGRFSLDAVPPALSYMGTPVWKSESSGHSEEWNASSPYVDHWKLLRKSGAQTIYVDEINWWPLVFSLKCREIVAKDAGLVGPNKAYIGLCSQRQPDSANPGRFRLYPWINPNEANRLNQERAKGALLNRSLKNNLLDWRFSDALLAVGSMQPWLLEGIRQLVLKSVSHSADGSAGGGAGRLLDQEYVIVSHSLGSYLIFAALDIVDAQSDTPQMKDWKKRFDEVLSHTSSVYFFANQLRLLELANLNSGNKMVDDLKRWSQLRYEYLDSQAGLKREGLGPPEIIAWSDPSDLLTWELPQLSVSSEGRTVTVKNRLVRNAPHWFWLFEGPTSAHDDYAANKKIIAEMFNLTESAETH